jgi:hypothetical protein
VIFHSYVSLPEGNQQIFGDSCFLFSMGINGILASRDGHAMVIWDVIL